MAGNRVYEVYETVEKLQEELAKYVTALSKKFIAEKGVFTVVLSGGYLIDHLRKLVEPPYVNEIDWSKWYIFWVDERAVGWEHADSNYKLANEGFLSKVKRIPAGNVCAISDELGKACEAWTPGGAEKAAIDYEEQLHKWVDSGVLKKSSNGFPKFDLQLLGMGPDGHMASLFPGHPQINEKERWVTYITDSPKPPKWRITLTLPVINSSSYIVFVMVGDGEADAVGKVLGKSPPDVPLPTARASAEIEQKWFLDKLAAKKL